MRRAPLRITRTDGQISIRDRPAPSWALGGFLLVGGGQRVVLSELWSHDQAGVAESVAVLATVCGLPTPGTLGEIAPGAV